MAEQEQVEPQDQNTQEQPDASSAGTEITDMGPGAQQDEHMVPKSRFDELNNELKKLRKAQADAAKGREEAERKAAEEQGKYQDLYEKAQAKLEQAQARARELELSALRRQVADKIGLPPALASRLQGEDEDALIADAKDLKAQLPKPQAPDINAATAAGRGPEAGERTEAERAELAALYGVNAEYIQ